MSQTLGARATGSLLGDRPAFHNRPITRTLAECPTRLISFHCIAYQSSTDSICGIFLSMRTDSILLRLLISRKLLHLTYLIVSRGSSMPIHRSELNTFGILR